MGAIIPGYAANGTDGASVSTYILVFKDTPGTVKATSYNSIDDLISTCGGTVKYRYDIIDGMAVTIPDSMAGQLKSLPNVAYVQKDHLVYAQMDRAVSQIGADQVWTSGYSGKGVKVAVLDSGIDPTHPDFANGSKVVAWADFVNGNNSTPYDDYGHGTFVSSVVAGTGEASCGRYKGVAPNASLVEAKVLDGAGVGHDSDVIKAIDWAIQNGSKVISMSFGGYTNQSYPETDSALYTAIDNVVSSGVIVVVAAGNYGPGAKSITYPGDDPNVITVGAVDRSDVIECVSSQGPTLLNDSKPDVVNVDNNIIAARAAGTSLGSKVANGDPYDPYYIRYSGTSVATPMTTGVIALMLEKNPALTPAQIKETLERTAKHLGYGNLAVPNNAYGWGRVQALDAVDNITYDGTLEFNKTAYRAYENSGNVTVGVNRIDEGYGTVSIGYNLSDSTAIAGKDYVAGNGTLVFGPGEFFKTFNVTLLYNPLNDSIFEGNRTINLTLTNPSENAGTDDYGMAVIDIMDDAPQPLLRLNQSAYSVNPSDGVLIINVTRANDAINPVTVQVNMSNGTAKAGQDFTAANGTLTFNRGEMSHTVQVPILNGSAQQGNLTFNITLSKPTGGAVLGTPGKAMVTIAQSNYTFTYHLVQGWNLISVPLNVAYTNITDVVPADALTGVEDIWGWNETAQNWMFYGPDPNDWFYSNYPALTKLETGHAYWIEMNKTANFTIEGTIPPSVPTIQDNLTSPWNFRGVTGLTPQTPASMYPSAECVWAWNATAQNWVFYGPDPNDWFYDHYPALTALNPGDGYWVEMSR